MVKWSHAHGQLWRAVATQRAFLFVKGPAGWAKAIIADSRYDDEILAEGDEDDAIQDKIGSAKDGSRIWKLHEAEDNSKLIPLSGQATVEHEAQSWANLWCEDKPYGRLADCPTMC